MFSFLTEKPQPPLIPIHELDKMKSFNHKKLKMKKNKFNFLFSPL